MRNKFVLYWVDKDTSEVEVVSVYSTLELAEEARKKAMSFDFPADLMIEEVATNKDIDKVYWWAAIVNSTGATTVYKRKIPLFVNFTCVVDEGILSFGSSREEALKNAEEGLFNHRKSLEIEKPKVEEKDAKVEKTV